MAHAGPYIGFLSASLDVLRVYGDLPVESMRLYRTPISVPIAFILERFSPDTFYHLAMVCRVGNRDIIVEKVAYPRVSLSYEVTARTEVYEVFTGGHHCDGNDASFTAMQTIARERILRGAFTLNQMLEATRRRMGDLRFYGYDAFNNNCQDFVRNCLMSIGCLTKAADMWLYQHTAIGKLRSSVPSFMQGIARGVTNIGNFWGRITGGRAAVRKRTRRHRRVL